MNAQAKGLSIITLWRAAFSCTPKGLTRFAGAFREISQVTGQGGKIPKGVACPLSRSKKQSFILLTLN